MHGRDTCYVESFNRTVISQIEKGTHLSHRLYMSKLYLAVLHWNEIVNRPKKKIPMLADAKHPNKSFSHTYSRKKHNYVNTVWKRFLATCEAAVIKTIVKSLQ